DPSGGRRGRAVGRRGSADSAPGRDPGPVRTRRPGRAPGRKRVVIMAAGERLLRGAHRAYLATAGNPRLVAVATAAGIVPGAAASRAGDPGRASAGRP